MAGGVRPFPLKPKSKVVRAIPRDVWSDDRREFARNTVQRQPREVAQYGANRGVGAPQISGRRVRAAVGGRGFNPAQSNAKFK